MHSKKLQWDYDAWNDYLYWQAKDKQKMKRINLLIKDIIRNPFEGIGKPEPLKYRKAWSRRIDLEHRLIYNQDENGNLLIISCKGHYEDL